jgi:pimeloyl-ACP methyl ester carboxylesterase
MNNDKNITSYKLPTNPNAKQGNVAQGFVTPKQDRTLQLHSIPPKRVLPIIFIPGIMGSNLRMNAERQHQLGNKNNIAWRPDNLAVTIGQANDTAAERQLRLDPETTELDTYDPDKNSTGDMKETADQRNENVRITFMYSPIKRLDGPLLQNDLPGTPQPKNRDQKARERGWGEIYFGSYQEILTTCEEKLNAAFAHGKLERYLKNFVANVDPKNWQVHSSTPLKEINEDIILNVVKGCWFPVHAMGYNWLRENSESGIILAEKIRKLIKHYNDNSFQCEKVILITHSMGGLVARAIIHPDIGNLNNEILGIVHGVMPAVGAAIAYKRIRCGFEGVGPGTKILGEFGTHVTPVLANAQGGLELLPNVAYGNHWLQVTQNGTIVKSLPQKGDPYEEIYKASDSWFSLLKKEWINPARAAKASFENTCRLLDRAKKFHLDITETYHHNSYAHYGADSKRLAWQKVIWEIQNDAKIHALDRFKIVFDNAHGKLRAIDLEAPSTENKKPIEFEIMLREAAEPGDQTVPSHSADAQLRSGKFKGVFRQTGYEHQSSYSEPNVIATTLYSIFQIASTMRWSK